MVKDPVEESQKFSVDEVLEVAEAEKEQLGHPLRQVLSLRPP